MHKTSEEKTIKGISYWFSTVSDGNMSFRYGAFDQVLNNRRTFFNKIDVDLKNTVLMWGVHGNEVVEAREEWMGNSLLDPENAPKVDGLITNNKDIYLGLLIADCLPVILYDPNKRSLALLHAGWRGTDMGILETAIIKFKDLYGTNPDDLKVIIGPCIRKKSYKFDNIDQEDDPRWLEYIKRSEEGEYMIDLVGFNQDLLIKSGVLNENIIDIGIDTAEDNRFYSHYSANNSEGVKDGRFICVVGIA